DVTNDNKCAESGLQRLMPILTDLVFDEIIRFQHFAHIVEITADTGKERISLDRLRGRLSQGGHGHAVRVSAGGPANEFLEQRMTSVRQLQQTHLSDDAETTLDQGQAS